MSNKTIASIDKALQSVLKHQATPIAYPPPSETLTATVSFLRLPAILQRLPVGRSTFWARVKTGEYPQPVKLGPRTTAWKAEDIDALIQTLGGK